MCIHYTSIDINHTRGPVSTAVACIIVNQSSVNFKVFNLFGFKVSIYTIKKTCLNSFVT